MAGTPTSSPGNTNVSKGELPTPGVVAPTSLGTLDAGSPSAPNPPTGPPPGPRPDGAPEPTGPPPPTNGESLDGADDGATVGSGRLEDGTETVGVGIGSEGGGGRVGVGSGGRSRQRGQRRGPHGGESAQAEWARSSGRLGSGMGSGSAPATGRARTSTNPISVVAKAIDVP